MIISLLCFYKSIKVNLQFNFRILVAMNLLKLIFVLSFYIHSNSYNMKHISTNLKHFSSIYHKRYSNPNLESLKSIKNEETINEFSSRKGRSSTLWKNFITNVDSSKSDSKNFGKKLQAQILPDVPDQLDCKHFGVCSGCTIRGNFTSSRLIKQATSYFKSESVHLNLHIGNIHSWRTHAKLAVQPLSRWGGLKIGLYKSGSHEVEPITDCRVHHPRINEAIEEFKLAASEVGVKAYQSQSITSKGKNIDSSGELRYLLMSLERNTSKVQLTLVWNALMYKEAEQSLPKLVKRLKSSPDLWHSITVNFQTSTSNTILNYNLKSWKLLWGPPYLKEKVGSSTFYFRPQIFRQVF